MKDEIIELQQLALQLLDNIEELKKYVEEQKKKNNGLLF